MIGFAIQSLSTVSLDTKIALASLLIALASLCIAWNSVRIGKNALLQAKVDSDRAQRDWRQRKWFNLYVEADRAINLLEAFQIKYGKVSADSNTWKAEWESTVHQLRRVCSMGAVFPINPATDRFFAAAAAIPNPEWGLPKGCFDEVSEAVEDIRQKALVDPTVLDSSTAT